MLNGLMLKIYVYDWDTCNLIEDVEKDFDGEKGFIDHEIVVQRISDEKFFKFTYTEYGQGDNNMSEQTAVEVFEKEKTIKYYE